MNYLVLLLAMLYCTAGYAVTALAVTQVAPGIYLHLAEHHWPDRNNHGEIANIGFIIGDKCVAVIDTGGSPQQGFALRSAIKQTTKLPVCYVINTHVHPDHIYGNIAFKSAEVKFIGHYKLARAMANRGDYYLSKAADSLDIHINHNNIIPPDIQVKDTLQLNLGNRVLQLTAHPSAHTDNDLSIYDSKTDTLWLADLLFLEHIPVLDGSITGWLKELDKLENSHYQLVIAGHGGLVNNWSAALHKEKAYLADLASEIRTMIKQGKTLEQAVEKVGLSAKNQWQLFEQFHRKNVTGAFAELEWEE